MGRKPALEEMSVFQLRVPVELRDTFNLVARQNDQTASQVMRALMREYIAKHGGVLQGGNHGNRSDA